MISDTQNLNPDETNISPEDHSVENTADNMLSVRDESSVETSTRPAGDRSGPILTAILTEKGLDLVLSEYNSDGTVVMSCPDYHALFLRDHTALKCLHQFREKTAQFRRQDLSTLDSAAQLPAGSVTLAPIRDRLSDAAADAKVLFTCKKNVPANVKPNIRKCVDFLITRMGLAIQDKSLILGALEIHNLAKLWHPENDPGGFKGKSEIYGKRLRLLNEQPALVHILLSMYVNLSKKSGPQDTLEVIGGNILTAADLISECLDPDDRLSREDCSIISRELKALSGVLLLPQVSEALIGMLEGDSTQKSAREQGNRVLIYTDSPDQIYALDARLRNEGLRVTICDRLQTFLSTCKRRQPDMIVFRLSCAPLIAIRILQFVSCSGLNISSIPFFLLVKKIFIPRLQILLRTGIEDIFDSDDSLDLLVLKLKKIQARLVAATDETKELSQQACGSRGKLSDMSLIDLLQALGPSRRTSRVTVSSEDSPGETLTIYLNHGEITFAQLGETHGAHAIHSALAWQNGTWIVEQVAESNLPEPNNNLPNEAILMEGCRLMDESART